MSCSSGDVGLVPHEATHLNVNMDGHGPQARYGSSRGDKIDLDSSLVDIESSLALSPCLSLYRLIALSPYRPYSGSLEKILPKVGIRSRHKLVSTNVAIQLVCA